MPTSNLISFAEGGGGVSLPCTAPQVAAPAATVGISKHATPGRRAANQPWDHSFFIDTPAVFRGLRALPRRRRTVLNQSAPDPPRSEARTQNSSEQKPG